ncbi:MAG: T9SS type A sorting domain-containing protein [Ignavibacteria bacterium]|nr:MAG: T9SS type A sorting domain-containing protein [Ignavibacteria bacterium]
MILLKYGLNPFGLSPVDSVVFDGFSANTDDTLKAMTIDLNNNIYLAVKSYEGALDGWDYYIAKYNRYLKEQWRKSYNSSGNATDEPNAIQVDTNGNVYVTGNGGSSALTLKYNSTGTLQWAGTYSNGYGMDVAAFNNAVYVTGGSPPGGNAILIKYNSSGTQQWAATYAPSNCSCDYTIGYRVKIDTTGNGIYVGGGHGDMVFLKYDSSGDSIWSYAYNGPSQNTDQMIDMATDVAGNILAAGAVRESDLLPPVDYDDFELVSLNVGGGFASKAAPMNPVLGTHPGRPRGYNLGQNYPNPFNPSTKISYFLSEDGRVILRIYDLLGRAVKTVLDGQYILKGPHEVSFDGSNLASGPYFYRLTVGDGKYYQVKQMMLLK